jgi:hypothetical protein
VDVLLLAVVNEILLDQERVALNLVDSRDNSSALDNGLELRVSLVASFCASNGNYLRAPWYGWRHRRRGPWTWEAR